MVNKIYTPLETSYTGALSTSNTPLGFDATQVVSLFASTSFLWSAGIMICVLAAGFMYMRAGAIRMQASEAGVRKSNEEIKRVTLGLLGVLSLFVILYTFNKGLLQGDVDLQGLKATPVTMVSGGGGDYAGAGATGVTPGPATTDGSEAANRAALSAVGITINHDPCTGSSGTGCTNVGGINPASITVLLKLKSECGCDVMVTGGTEPGHSPNSNHGVGKEAIDVSLTPQLSDFFKAHGTILGNTSPCNIRYGYGGFIFWDEATGCDGIGGPRHFHASFSGR
jgi:hypothetical protein